MITVNIRKQGGATIMTIPADVLKILNAEVGCVFHAIRPPIPRASGHLVHADSATQSTAIRPGGRSEATLGFYS